MAAAPLIFLGVVLLTLIAIASARKSVLMKRPTQHRTTWKP